MILKMPQNLNLIRKQIMNPEIVEETQETAVKLSVCLQILNMNLIVRLKNLTILTLIVKTFKRYLSKHLRKLQGTNKLLFEKSRELETTLFFTP